MKYSSDTDECITNHKIKLDENNNIFAIANKDELLEDKEVLQSCCKNLNDYAIDCIIGCDYESNLT